MPSPRDRPPYAPLAVLSGKYSLRQTLGEGGMAVVYAAVDLSCNRQVAVKVLRPSVARVRALSEAHLRREAAVLVRLRQRTPHVTEVLTAGITDDDHHLPYYVMERLRGRTLFTLMTERFAANGRFEILELSRTMTEVATALACADELEIVHRDVKPQNVYVAEHYAGTRIAKLLDFGLSSPVSDARGDAASTGVFVGTRRYAAPEQLRGAPPTTAADVYALGLTIHELLTYRLPGDREPPLSDLRPDAPSALVDLVARCLSRDAAARPSARDVVSALRQIEAAAERRLLGEPDVSDAAQNVTDVDAEPFGLEPDPAAGLTHVISQAFDAEPPSPSDSKFFERRHGPDETAPMPTADPVADRARKPR